MHWDYLEIFTTIIGLVPENVILLACIHLVRRAPGVDSMLMVVGSSLTFVLTFGWMVPNFWPEGNLVDGESAGDYYQLLSYAFAGAGLLFTAGLFMFAMKQGPALRSSADVQ